MPSVASRESSGLGSLVVAFALGNVAAVAVVRVVRVPVIAVGIGPVLVRVAVLGVVGTWGGSPVPGFRRLATVAVAVAASILAGGPVDGGKGESDTTDQGNQFFHGVFFWLVGALRATASIQEGR